MCRYIVLLIKPDAIRDGLLGPILQEVKNNVNAKEIFRKNWKIPDGDINLLYQDWINRPEFPFIKANLLQGESVFILLAGDQNIFSDFTRIKGKKNKGGIRFQFRGMTTEELEAQNASKEEIQRRRAENRIHTTDNQQETVLLCRLALNESEIDSLKKTAYSLFREIKL